MRLFRLKVGQALLCKKETGINETIDPTIKEGEYYVEVRHKGNFFQECKLARQPKEIIWKKK